MTNESTAKPMERVSSLRIEGMERIRLDTSAKAVQHQIMDSESENSEAALTQSEKFMKMEEESFYSASENTHGDDNIWGLLSGVGGNIYEWYDFAVYGLLAPEIGSSFFPSKSKELQLINSFGVYLAAFLMRPLGAILFGEMGDRIVGRKNALVVSIVLITVPSVAMGLLPTYEMWGPAAPILLVILRMMQGLSVGGQLAGSYVLSIEQSSSTNRGFRGSVCDASSVSR
jgi:MHS family proline/betaine transporter-like MFS transporter